MIEGMAYTDLSNNPFKVSAEGWEKLNQQLEKGEQMENTVKITYTFPDGAGGTFTDTDQIQIEHLQAEVQQIIDKAVRNQSGNIIKAFASEDYRGNGPTFTLGDVRRIIKGENK